MSIAEEEADAAEDVSKLEGLGKATSSSANAAAAAADLFDETYRKLGVRAFFRIPPPFLSSL